MAEEARQICEKLDIYSCDMTTLSKAEFRKYVTQACHAKNEERLCEQAKGKEKCERIRGEEYEKQTYVSDAKIEDVRGMYRTRFKLLPFASNYSHARKFEKTNFLCRCEKAREEEIHLLSHDCPVYADIREQFGELDDDKELVKYFTMVLARRDELDSNKE